MPSRLTIKSISSNSKDIGQHYLQLITMAVRCGFLYKVTNDPLAVKSNDLFLIAIVSDLSVAFNSVDFLHYLF